MFYYPIPSQHFRAKLHARFNVSQLRALGAVEAKFFSAKSRKAGLKPVRVWLAELQSISGLGLGRLLATLAWLRKARVITWAPFQPDDGVSFTVSINPPGEWRVTSSVRVTSAAAA